MPVGVHESLFSRESSQIFSYVLIVRCGDVAVELTRNRVFLSKGYYVYVGSANIKRPYLRVLRHLIKGSKKLKWHVDYLTEACEPVSALLCSGVHEKTLYEVLMNSDRMTPSIKGFGCSDYRRVHETHLFKFDVSVESLHEIIKYLTSILKMYCDKIEVFLS
ncbi:MAG: DUF123 domain-containing protein [Zestosphaera sp.]